MVFILHHIIYYWFMSKLFTLLFFTLTSWAHAQAVTKSAFDTKIEVNINEEITEIQSPQNATESIKDKSPKISSAARKSSIVNNVSEREALGTKKSNKQTAHFKSVSQARRITPDGRPTQINIPIIPVPGLAKPNRMTVPNRRLSLPVGKS